MMPSSLPGTSPISNASASAASVQMQPNAPSSSALRSPISHVFSPGLLDSPHVSKVDYVSPIASPSVVSPLVESRSHTTVIPMNAHDMQTRSMSEIVKPKTIMSLETVITAPIPTYFSQVVKSPHWQATMSDEYSALMANGTWDLVPYFFRMNLVGCKWIYKTKYKSDGSIE